MFNEEPQVLDVLNDESQEVELYQGNVPRQFKYSELAVATGEFSDKKKLGEGGFGKEIILGICSALQYLHQEWEQCVLNRDIKPSNVMLDESFNPKLGEFGLARLVIHGQMSRTTVLSVGSQSFVKWVWDLYGHGQIINAADVNLNGEFDGLEVQRVMVTALWCTHPDRSLRFSIRQAMNILRLEEPLPQLPAKMPVATFTAPLDSMPSSEALATAAIGSSNSKLASVPSAVVSMDGFRVSGSRVDSSSCILRRRSALAVGLGSSGMVILRPNSPSSPRQVCCDHSILTYCTRRHEFALLDAVNLPTPAAAKVFMGTTTFFYLTTPDAN
nr:unnamed protein product [Digitaria exilis]